MRGKVKNPCGVRHHQKTFHAGITFERKKNCEECGAEFTNRNHLVLYGSCKIQLCRKCWLKKLG